MFYNIKNEHIAIILLALLLIIVFQLRKTKLSRTAKKSLGQLEKSKGSYETGFKSSSFENKMRANGWQIGYDWCAIFVSSVARDTFATNKNKLAVIKKLINPSSQQTYNNLVEASKKYAWIRKKTRPCAGCIVTWQSVASPSKGHIGIITKGGNNFKTIEGNVQAGNGYDGVARKTHNINEQNKNSGNRLRKYFIQIT